MPDNGMWQGINSEVGDVITIQKYSFGEEAVQKV